MPVKKVLMPLPDRDFDPSEAALTWQILRAAGHEVRFATPKGLRAFADPRMLSGEGLDLWGWIPLLKKLKLFGLMLRADRFGRAAYAQMEQDPHFLNPLAYAHIQTQDFDALALPGGHAKGMRVYLESAVLQAKVVEFFEEHGVDEKMRPIAAVCHGALLAARSISPTTGRSMLYGRKTTALTWKLEKSAWRVGKFLTRFWEPNYYRTYVESPGEPPAHWSVESEVKRSLKSPISN